MQFYTNLLQLNKYDPFLSLTYDTRWHSLMNGKYWPHYPSYQ